jgi:quinolinate synthase
VLVPNNDVKLISKILSLKREKRFIPASEQAGCPSVKLITLKKVLQSLEAMASYEQSG